MKQAIFVDIDGTLADSSGRVHLLPENEGDADWIAHSLECWGDPPIVSNIELIQLLSDQYAIVLCSGRSEIAYGRTVAWLARHGVKWDRLILRPMGDRTNNATYKMGVVRRLENEGYQFVLGLEDYHKTASALREHGIPTVLVVPPWEE